MPVGYTSQRSVQVLGFDDCGRLTPLRRLIRFLFVRPAFCLGLPSDSQSPATPLPLANTSPCRVCRGLSPPSRLAHHHSELNSASHGATRHAWRTTKKPCPVDRSTAFSTASVGLLVDRVAQHFSWYELDDFLGSDFDGSASRRVAASASWTLCHFQFADARQSDFYA